MSIRKPKNRTGSGGSVAALATAAPPVLALLNTHRRAVVSAILDHGPISVGDLVSRTGLSQTVVSGQLMVLRAHGMVVGDYDGRRRFYRVDREAVDRAARELLDALGVKDA